MAGAYVRLRVKLPKQRALTTPYITDALSDKVASVRRYAIATLTSMILTHPFRAMYGGFLNQPEWEACYQQVKQLKRLEAKQVGMLPGASEETAALAAGGDDEKSVEGENDEEDEGEGRDDDETDETRRKNTAVKQKGTSEVVDPAFVQQPLDAGDMVNLTRLRLTKRYIADGLEFIRQVEHSMDVLGQLLGSTSKAEASSSSRLPTNIRWQVPRRVTQIAALTSSYIFRSVVWHKEDTASYLDERQYRRHL